MRKLYLVLGIVISFLVIGTIRPVEGARQSTPEDIISLIEDVIDEWVRDPSNLVPEFLFEIDQAKRTVRYNLVDCSNAGYLGFSERDPWKLPFQLQLYIVTIDEVLFRSGIDENLWMPHLEEAIDLVYWTVVDITETQSVSRLEKILQERRDQYYQIIKQLKADLNHIARINGFEPIDLTPGGCGGRESMFRVHIATDPPGGSVKIITYLSFLIHKNSGTPKEEWQWTNLLRETELLLGRYWYSASWPGGGYAEGSIEIDSSISDGIFSSDGYNEYDGTIRLIFRPQY